MPPAAMYRRGANGCWQSSSTAAAAVAVANTEWRKHASNIMQRQQMRMGMNCRVVADDGSGHGQHEGLSFG